jgi:hypothetical protein
MYIKILNGQPHGHPILADNFITAYPDIDINNLPDDWAPFIRLERPRLETYETLTESYIWDGDTVTDSLIVTSMTADEITAKQNAVKESWISSGGHPDWSFDADTCTHKPPPMPDDGQVYVWDFNEERWVVVVTTTVDLGLPSYPTDGQTYRYSDLRGTWIPKP